jgi:integrase
MAKHHNEPYRLYKRGETYHAYISYISSSGERLFFRGTTREVLPEKAAQFCLNFIAEQEKRVKLRTGQDVDISTDEAFVLFFENVGKYHNNSSDTYNKLKILLEYFPNNIGDICDADIMNLINDYRNKNRANGTINRYLALLSAVINFCDDRNYRVPKLKISKYKLKEPAENIKYLKDWDEAKAIIDKAAKHLKPIIYTALYTGMRLGNILNLKWENIDFKNKTINITVKDKTKQGGKNHSIPLIAQLEEILKALPQECEYVFTHKGKKINSIKTAWRNIFFKRGDKDSGYALTNELRDKSLPYKNFHTLRHTAGTWILKKTNNLKITKEILGHADIKTTLKYAHVLDDEKRNALNNVFS